MNTFVMDTPAETSNEVEAIEAAITELSANELALVGGGTANVCWL
jgi:hypothetical protein